MGKGPWKCRTLALLSVSASATIFSGHFFSLPQTPISINYPFLLPQNVSPLCWHSPTGVTTSSNLSDSEILKRYIKYQKSTPTLQLLYLPLSIPLFSSMFTKSVYTFIYHLSLEHSVIWILPWSKPMKLLLFTLARTSWIAHPASPFKFLLWLLCSSWYSDNFLCYIIVSFILNMHSFLRFLLHSFLLWFGEPSATRP